MSDYDVIVIGGGAPGEHCAGEYQAGIAAANILGDPREADYEAEIATARPVAGEAS